MPGIRRSLDAGAGERTPRRGQRRGMRRLYQFDGLRGPRVFMTGPKWRKYFGVRAMAITEIAPEAPHLHRPGKKLLVFTFEHDVRELITEELRPGVFAQWSDPWERIGCRRTAVNRTLEGL